MTSFTQNIDKFPVYPIIVSNVRYQTLTIRCNAVSLEGRVNFIRGTIEPYGTLSVGLAFGNISGEEFNKAFGQQDYDGPAIGFGLGSKFHITNYFGLTLDLRVLGSSGGYKNNMQPASYNFNGNKFDSSYNAAFLIAFFQF